MTSKLLFFGVFSLESTLEVNKLALRESLSLVLS
jgi:hypothetical protein